jgi:HK97 family phage prohead protease
MKPDFGGYATKAGLKCTDGRTIMPNAFAHLDKKQVPLLWMHGQNDPENVLGHAMLEARADGLYAHAYFNSTPKAQSAKVAVQHKDVNALSIYANNLRETSNKEVHHGNVREVSLVIAGANPGAVIDFVSLRHGDGELEEIDEAIIHTGLELEVNHADDGPSVKQVIATMTEEPWPTSSPPPWRKLEL